MIDFNDFFIDFLFWKKSDPSFCAEFDGGSQNLMKNEQKSWSFFASILGGFLSSKGCQNDANNQQKTVVSAFFGEKGDLEQTQNINREITHSGTLVQSTFLGTYAYF